MDGSYKAAQSVQIVNNLVSYGTDGNLPACDETTANTVLLTERRW
jgi:hypothetical protein